MSGDAVEKKSRGRTGKADKNEDEVKEVKKRGRTAAAIEKKSVEVEDGVAPVKKGRGGRPKAASKPIAKAATPGARRGRSKKDEKKGSGGDDDKED